MPLTKYFLDLFNLSLKNSTGPLRNKVLFTFGLILSNSNNSFKGIVTIGNKAFRSY